jgi:hypothetical protein
VYSVRDAGKRKWADQPPQPPSVTLVSLVADGKLFSATKETKVTLGGCGG